MTAAEHGLAVLYALGLWWASTGLILYLDGLPRRTFPVTLTGASAAALAALAALAAGFGEDSVAGAYVGFTCAIVVWGWNEVAFLLGYVTGPNRSPCPPGAAGRRRLKLAVATILYHEIAILAGAGLIALAASGPAGQVALWTYLLLMAMRLSAKLNVFLGVPNHAEDMLPPHLAYLSSHFRRRPINPLFPLSVTGATVLLVVLVMTASGPALPVDAAAATLLAALVALAIVEHWMLILPLPAASLWRWSLRSRDHAGAQAAVAAATAAARASVSREPWSRP
ncbi:putative photosynthetic complex assembly protein 2 [Tepidamorphus gemmatus]|uniref:Putative photosynthetic complex assembly protein 2 n=1 Tax=Tepidamorphus gemmatus TaxID=747076 RepID=A0A4V2UXV6_9HYPH|nr:putative photosynthetic complex assembly protein PuhE [Tepidamorphus gemmatus]TCT04968.1 putative photosynthetic complex assembly protein 2 [Tepidamorphus gemmatus]